MLSQQSQEGLRNLAPGAKSAGKSDGRRGWFRVGMLTAALGAPLIARWNDLRTRQRLEALREDKGAQLAELGANVGANIGSSIGAGLGSKLGSGLGAGLDRTRNGARALLAQSQPRARAAIKSAQTASEAAMQSAHSATAAARDLARTTAKRVAKSRQPLADALESAASAQVATIGKAGKAVQRAAKRTRGSTPPSGSPGSASASRSPGSAPT